MRGSRNLQNSCMRKMGGNFTQHFKVKTRIAQAPDDLHWHRPKIWKLRLNFEHAGIAWMLFVKRDVLNKIPDRSATCDGLIGRVVALFDRTRQRSHNAEIGCEFQETHRCFRQEFPDDRTCGPTNDLGQALYFGERGVEVDHSLYRLDAAHRQTSSDGSTPIVHHEGIPIDSKLTQKILDLIDSLRGSIVAIGWMIGKTAAYVVWGNHTKVAAQVADQLAEIETPSGISVEADDHRRGAVRWTFVHVVHLATTDGYEVPLEREDLLE